MVGPERIAAEDAPESDTTAHRRKGDGAEASSLRVVLGDEVASYPLPARGEIALGRGGDIVVAHLNISRRHLAIRATNRLEASDLGSTNLTTLNGTPLEANTWVPIRSGDLLVMGGEALVVVHDGTAHEPRSVPTRHMGQEALETEIGKHLAKYASAQVPFAVCRVQSRASCKWIDVLGAVLLKDDAIVMVSDVEAVLLLSNRNEEQAEVTAKALEEHLGRCSANARVRLHHCPKDGTELEDLIEKPPADVRGHRTTMRPAGPLVRNAQMVKLYALVEEVAPSPVSVLVLGETGVGKDVLAHAIHQRSPRAVGPFVSLNCASLPETLLESELFGYEKGAFTGAVSSKQGLLETAEGGTIFLDEIGEMPAATQAKFLRVLEERTVRRVGALKPRPIDVRLVAATNRDLQREIAQGRFRADLFYRVNGLSLTVPPLRERVDEIAIFAAYFASTAAGILNKSTPQISAEARTLLEAYAWPGNIRELRNVIERAVLLCRERAITPELLPPEVLGETSPPRERSSPPSLASVPSGTSFSAVERATQLTQEPRPPAEPEPREASGIESLLAHGIGEIPRQTDGTRLLDEMESLEKQRIIEALAKCNGNQTRAAQVLGITRRMLISRIERYNLPRPRMPQV